MTIKRIARFLRSSISMSAALGGSFLMGGVSVPTADAALLSNRPATSCEYANLGGGPWNQRSALTGASQVGDVLFERTVGVYVYYKYGVIGANKKYELVAGAGWITGTGVDANGWAVTNVPGIALQLVVHGRDGVDRVVHLRDALTAMDKREIVWDPDDPFDVGSNTITNYVQRLVLTVPPDQLPEGDLVVTGLGGSVQLRLKHVSYEQGKIGLGDLLDTAYVPESKGCNTDLLYFGAEALNLGGSGTVPIPSTCEVLTQTEVPVSLGTFSTADFPNPGDTSPEQSFSVSMSKCSAKAKPVVTFTDKNGAAAGTSILNLKQATGAAQGFGIVMHRAEGGGRVTLGTAYEAPVVGDVSKLELKASYIRTATDASQMRTGSADGNAQFTFTFP